MACWYVIAIFKFYRVIPDTESSQTVNNRYYITQMSAYILSWVVRSTVII
jgi:hypothetical protein